jgi:hypothetical protein
MNKLSRRGIATAAAVLATAAGSLAWGVTSASAATATSHHPGPMACTTQQLGVWVNADSANPGAGTIAYNLNYTNLGEHPCWLSGYPYAIAEDAHQMPLGAPAHVIPGVGHPVMLMPGASAHSVLDYLEGAITPACKPEPASYLSVGLPHNKIWRHAFFALPICSKHNVVNLKVGVIQPGAA